jgi:TRAP-type transport system periplasmic protein
MKKGFLTAIALFLAVSMVLGVCTTPVTAADAKPIIIKQAEAFPAAGFYYPHLLWLKDQIDRRTEGRVQFKIYFGGSLSGWPQALPALQTGLADMAQVCPPYFPSEMPLSMIAEMVGVSSDLWVGLKASAALYNEDPYIKAEHEKLGIKPLFSHHSGVMHYGFRGDVSTFDQMQGKTIRTYGGSLFEAEKGIGLKPVFMGYGDIYEALARKTMDGSGFTYIVSDGFKHWEVMKSVVEVGAGYSIGLQRAMRIKDWNKLPADIQKIFMKLQSDWIDYFAKSMYAETALLQNKWKNFGVKVRQMTPADQKKLNEEILPAAQKAFVKQTEKMPGGEHAGDVWKHYQELRDRYQKIVDTKGYPWAPKK